jgi:hypothetical protein
MTKPLATKKKIEPIKVAFTPCDVVAKEGEVPVLEVLGWHELMRRQTEEFDRVGAEINERIEGLFQDYGVARTGDDLADFRNLALQMAIKRFPDFPLKDDPTLLEHLFPFYKVTLLGNCVDAWDYRRLVVEMMGYQRILRIEKQSYDCKPGNPLAQ